MLEVVVGNIPTLINARKDIIGWNCPTQSEIPGNTTLSHHTIRGYNAIITLGEYRLSNWVWPDASSSSTILHHNGNIFEEVTDCMLIPLDTEEKLIKRIKILILFS
jgi:hypothetical protein